LQKLGRHKEALAAYEEAAQRGPPDAETELNRGNVLQKLGRLEEALAAYDLSSRYRRGYPQALYNKGIAGRKTRSRLMMRRLHSMLLIMKLPAIVATSCMSLVISETRLQPSHMP